MEQKCASQGVEKVKYETYKGTGRLRSVNGLYDLGISPPLKNFTIQVNVKEMIFMKIKGIC